MTGKRNNSASDVGARRVRPILLRSLALLFLFAGSLAESAAQGRGPDQGEGYRSASSFVENRGQWDESARYQLSLGGMRAWFVDGGLVYDLTGPDGTRHVLRWSLLGAGKVAPSGREREETWRSWFIGERVIEGVPAYRELFYSELLPGVDARFDTRNGALKYDLILSPGVDPASLRMEYEGALGIEIDGSGTLHVRTTAGLLSEAPPEAFQEIDGEHVPVDARFILDGDRIGIEFGEYDPSRVLVIDPAVRFSTYLGGNGFDEGRGVSVDAAGNIYVTGQTRSADFPVSRGQNPGERDLVNGSRDLFVAKFDPTGQRMIWGTYFGGNEDDDPIGGLRITRDNRVIVAGVTLSANFPRTLDVVGPGPIGGVDGFVFSLQQEAQGRPVILEWSTYLGGLAADTITAFDVNSSGNIILTGYTSSFDFQFLLPPGGFDNILGPNGTVETFVVEMSRDGRRLVAGTFLGGASDDRSADLVVGAANKITVVGRTSSDDFRTSPNPVFPARSNLGDGFVAQLSANLSSLDYGTYLGGSGEDFIRSVALDSNGLIYVTGHTASNDFPNTIGLPFTGSWFVSRIDPFATGIDQLSYSRYLTSGSSDRGIALAVDAQGRATMGGVTSSMTFPIEGGGVSTPDRGGNDLALVRLAGDGRSIEQSSVVGGSEDDVPARQAWLSPIGDFYLTGGTRSQDFPLSRFPFDSTLNTIAGETEPDAFLLAWSFNPRPNLVGPATIALDTLRCDSVVRDTFYIYNDGERALRIEANAFTVEPTQFFLEKPTRLPNLTVNPGDSVEYIVGFASTESGTAENELLIFTFDPLLGKDSLPITIRSARSAPAISALPSEPPRQLPIQFGRVPVCRDKTISVTLFANEISSITVEPPTFASGGTVFSMAPGVNFPLVIPKGGEQVIQLVYSPERPVQDTDTLVFRIRECAQSILKVPVVGQGEVVQLTGLPDEIDFPQLQFCSSERDTTIAITNSGNFDLVIRDTSIQGQGFLIEFPGPLPDTLAPRESVNITVRFAPPAAGDYNAEARITIDPCDTVLRIRLVGSHRDEIIPVPSVDTLDFDMLPMCPGVRTPTDMTLDIGNPSDSLINLGTPLIPAPFTSCGPFPTRILPGSSALLCLVYDPPLGNRNDTARLLIPYSVGDCVDTLRVVLVGGRSVVELTPDVTTIDLPPLDACESYRDTVFVLHNNSVAEISLDSTHITRGAEILEPSLSTPVPPNDSVTLRVRFSPTTSGTSTESIRLFLSGAGCIDTLDLTLTGSADGIVVTTDRDSVTFPPILACDPPAQVSDTLYVSWTGTTGDDVRIASLRILGERPEFTLIDSAVIVRTVIGPGERIPVPLVFSSGAEGVIGDTLEIVVEPCMDTILVVLVGETIELDISISNVNFGDVAVRSSSSEDIVIHNNSPIPLTLDTIFVAGLPFAPDTGFPTLPVTLDPDSVIVLPMTFSPTTTGDARDSIVLIFSNGCDRRQTVLLTGRGVTLQEEVELCIGGVYAEPGIVGDTVSIPVRSEPAVELDNPTDLVFRFRFDPARFQFVESVNGASEELDEVNGEVLVRVAGVKSLPGDLPSIRLRLLGGAEPFAVVRLDSIRLSSGNGLVPSLCDSSAIVSIANRCFVTGLSLGKYPNRLERPVPNPAHGVVEITFQQLEDAETILRLWDAQGREVLRPLEGTLPGGRYTVRFSVDALPPGLYFYGVQAGSWSAVEGLMIQR